MQQMPDSSTRTRYALSYPPHELPRRNASAPLLGLHDDTVPEAQVLLLCSTSAHCVSMWTIRTKSTNSNLNCPTRNLTLWINRLSGAPLNPQIPDFCRGCAPGAPLGARAHHPLDLHGVVCCLALLCCVLCSALCALQLN
jgi:hypothetical protein